MSKKIYLGDSVYAEKNSGGIVLTTENGYGPSNTIFLDPEVFAGLFSFAIQNKLTAIREGEALCRECSRSILRCKCIAEDADLDV